MINTLFECQKHDFKNSPKIYRNTYNTRIKIIFVKVLLVLKKENIVFYVKYY